MTSIIKKCKQDYYNNLLDNSKNNIKLIWNTLNNIIRNKSRMINYPQYYKDGDKIINNMEEVVESFNKFFVEAGQNVVEKITNVKKLTII